MDKFKVLIVDDEKRMRILVKDFLNKADFEVIEASNGGEALDLFYEQKDIHKACGIYADCNATVGGCRMW